MSSPNNRSGSIASASKAGEVTQLVGEEDGNGVDPTSPTAFPMATNNSLVDGNGISDNRDSRGFASIGSSPLILDSEKDHSSPFYDKTQSPVLAQTQSSPKPQTSRFSNKQVSPDHIRPAVNSSAYPSMIKSKGDNNNSPVRSPIRSPSQPPETKLSAIRSNKVFIQNHKQALGLVLKNFDITKITTYKPFTKAKRNTTSTPTNKLPFTYKTINTSTLKCEMLVHVGNENGNISLSSGGVTSPKSSKEKKKTLAVSVETESASSPVAGAGGKDNNKKKNAFGVLGDGITSPFAKKKVHPAAAEAEEGDEVNVEEETSLPTTNTKTNASVR